MGFWSWLINKGKTKAKENKLNKTDGLILDVIRTRRPEMVSYYYQDRAPTDIVGDDLVIVWKPGTNIKDREWLLKKLKEVA
jgi:hypothetical protein